MRPANDPVNRKDRFYLVLVALFIGASFSLLIAQFYKIQIIEGDKWTREARRQHYFIVNEPFLRGTFFSNTSVKKKHPEEPQPFVIDIQKFHLHVDPDSLPLARRGEIAKRLLAFLNLSVEEKLAFRGQFDRKSRNRKLAMWLEKETKDSILEWWLPYAKRYKIPRNALFFVSDYQRSYPFGKLLGQVLHTIQNNKDEVTKQAVPTGGLELWGNSYLSGKPGKRRMMRSPRNSLETGEVIAKPQNGANIYLTINHCLQAIAEEEIEKGVKQSKAKSGWAVMMDPKTGEILALAQYPYFYPLEYQSYFNDPIRIEHTKVKAVTDANEPGSIIKPFSLAVGLKANEVLRGRGEKGIFDPSAKTATSDSHFPGRSKPLKDTHLHHFLNMDMALQKSSNIYMARVIQKTIERLGNGFYRAVLHDTFGFGKKTNLELPGETRGVLPTLGKKHPNGALEWSPATPYSMAMGHNIQANSIQLVRAYSVFANGGYLVQPTLIRKIVKKNEAGEEEILLDNTLPERVQQFPKVLSKEIIKEVVKAMKYTTKTGGTARRADIWGYTEAGKTGTPNKIVSGRYSETLYCPSFVGFAPVKNPAFVLIVTLDEPEYGYAAGIGKKHHGGTCAAPVFREIAARALEYLGIAPDDPYGYPVGDPRYDPNKADWAIETRQLKEMYEKWNNKTDSH